MFRRSHMKNSISSSCSIILRSIILMKLEILIVFLFFPAMASYYVLDASSLVDVPIEQEPSLAMSEQSYLARICPRCTLQEGKEVSAYPKDVVGEGKRSRMGQGKVSEKGIRSPYHPSGNITHCQLLSPSSYHRTSSLSNHRLLI